MKRILFFAFVLIHLSVVVYNNIIIEEQAFKVYNHQEETSKALSLISENKVLYNVFDAYSKYTGTETGFGFYAPNVASDVVLLVTGKTHDGRVLFIESPRFHSQEGAIRFASVMQHFKEKLRMAGDHTKKEYNLFLNAILKSVAMWYMQRITHCKNVHAEVLMYNLPSVSEVQKSVKPNYYKIGEYDYSVR